MKTFSLFLLCLFFSAPCLLAQAAATPAAPPPEINDAIQAAVTSAVQEAVNSGSVPPQYAGYGVLLLAVLAAWGRYNKARKNGLAPWPAFLTVFNGSANTVLVIACLCMLSLSSCATWAAIAASPFGRATIATADQLAAQVVKTTEQDGLQEIIIQAGAKVAALNAQGVNSDAVKETLRLSQIAGFMAVIEAAQDKYLSLTGVRFSAPKQPVNVTPAPVAAVRVKVAPEGVPACMQLVSVPDYGVRVAESLRGHRINFAFATASVR